MMAVNFADVVNTADVGMRNLARKADFGVKAFDAIDILRKRSGNKFQRDNLTELEIVCFVDHAHAAAAKQAEDAIAISENGTGGKIERAGNGRIIARFFRGRICRWIRIGGKSGIKISRLAASGAEAAAFGEFGGAMNAARHAPEL